MALADVRTAAHLENVPGEAWRLAQLVVVLDVNEATRTVFGFEHGDQLPSRIGSTFGPDALTVFADGVEALWRGEATFRHRVRFRRMDGEELTALVTVPLPRTDPEAARVAVSIVDITPILQVQEASRIAQEAMTEAALGAVRAIVATIEKRDPYTAGHQAAVAEFAVKIAAKLGFDDFRAQGIGLAASIQNVGNVSVPAELLNRPGALTSAQLQMVTAHVEHGFEIISKTSFPWPVDEMIRQHHERLDGSGYPFGLKGDDILDDAQVIGIADVALAIMSHRPYRPARSPEEAIAAVEEARGVEFRAAIADACLELLRSGDYPTPE